MASAGDVSEGYAQLFSTAVAVKVKEQERREEVEVVFKILIKQEDDALQSVRFQISNDRELDFLFEVTYDEAGFSKLKQSQGLEIEFTDFPNVVRQQIVTLDKEAKKKKENPEELQRFKAVFTGEDDKIAEEDDGYEPDEEEDVAGESPKKNFLIVYQKLDFCRVQVFKFAFESCEITKASQISQARYDELSAKLKALETEYKDLLKRVQRTSPKLLDGLKLEEGDDQ
jgi:hypothetical protein